VPEPPAGSVQVVVKITNATGGNGAPVSWIGIPEPASGGFVLWLGPGALAVAHWWTNRRRRKETRR
jgi:hypothetical protein